MLETELTPEEAAPAPPEAVARAREALAIYNVLCFWFRSDDAPLTSVADVRLVARRLRENGDMEAWHVAREIERCL